MKENLFKIGYSSYLNKDNLKNKSNKNFKIKIFFIFVALLFFCLTLNIFLIYKFINILEASSFM